MFWAAGRQARRPEDITYSLLGIFGVNMPLLYGEGPRAFIRLQEEIMRHSDDQSIFAWCDSNAQPDALYGLLAPSPDLFANSRSILAYESWEAMPPYSMTNRGLRIELPVQIDRKDKRLNVAALNCPVPRVCEENTFLGIYIQKLSAGDDQYARVRANEFSHLTQNRGVLRTLYIKQPIPGRPTPFRRGSGVFPHHILVLSGSKGLEQYRMASTLPPFATSSKTINPGPAIGRSGDEPGFVVEARGEARSWVPPHCRSTFPVPKARKTLAGAVSLQHGESESSVCLMFGSTANHNIGLGAVDMDITFPASQGKDGKPNVQLADLQPMFEPNSPGRWTMLAQIEVRILVTVHVFHGGKYFVTRVQFAERNQDGSDSELEGTDTAAPVSETMRSEPAYISAAPHAPKPKPPPKLPVYRRPIDRTQHQARNDRLGLEEVNTRLGIASSLVQIFSNIDSLSGGDGGGGGGG